MPDSNREREREREMSCVSVKFWGDRDILRISKTDRQRERMYQRKKDREKN
jgi:hypothetical protein